MLQCLFSKSVSNAGMLNHVVVAGVLGKVTDQAVDEAGLPSSSGFAPAGPPIPSALWLFGSGLLNLVGIANARNRLNESRKINGSVWVDV